MAEYIDRDKVLDAILALPLKMDEQGYGWLGRMGVWQMLSDFPAADVVSKAAYDQVAWERHLAEVQLKSIGKSLGEKMDDVQPVKHGKWILHSGGVPWNVIECSECGEKWHHWQGYAMPNYCSNCGARMDGET